jgi:hypothetical protein
MPASLFFRDRDGICPLQQAEDNSEAIPKSITHTYFMPKHCQLTHPVAFHRGDTRQRQAGTSFVHDSEPYDQVCSLPLCLLSAMHISRNRMASFSFGCRLVMTYVPEHTQRCFAQAVLHHAYEHGRYIPFRV